MSEAEREPISELAHALRTPIAVIQGYAELLIREEDELPADKRRDYAGRIREAAGELRTKLDAAIGRL